MPMTFLLARDHLEQAATILDGVDTRSRQLRNIIERTIGLMDEFDRKDNQPDSTVVDFAACKRRRERRGRSV